MLAAHRVGVDREPIAIHSTQVQIATQIEGSLIACAFGFERGSGLRD